VKPITEKEKMFMKLPGTAQPYLHGYNAKEILIWEPNTNSHDKFLRSRVPLATRIAPFPATQAKPHLSNEPQVMNLSADYDKTNIAYKYNDTYCCNVLKFWQYTDIYAGWHGLPIKDSPTEQPVYGVLNLPNPAYTDAAHRNGVLSLGCWFWPREEEIFSDLVQQNMDGSFPVADKMIEMALYFGFDGYFINQEAPIAKEDAEKLKEMIAYLQTKSPDYFHFQWYDTLLTNGELVYQNQLSKESLPWLLDDGKRTINNSMFINYAWNDEKLEASIRLAASHGLDPQKDLFPGTENDKYGYNPPYDTRQIFPEVPKYPATGWGLFGTDFVWNRYHNNMDPDDQHAVYQRERRYWSGPLEDPSDLVGRTTYKPYKDPYHAVDPEAYTKWDGVAHYIPARSVIHTYPFMTRFNIGHGKAFFHRGKQVAQQAWNNASIQDILPTWQWWIQCNDKQEQQLPVPDRSLTIDYDVTTAYDGGSSLKITGTLKPENKTEIRLFKTALEINKSVTLAITSKADPIGCGGLMEVGLMFADEPTHFAWMACKENGAGWQTDQFSLQPFEGRTIAAIGLRVSVEKETAVTYHIGELAITEQEKNKPDKPSGFTIDQAYIENQCAALFLSWDFEEKDIWYYDIFRYTLTQQREHLGRIYDEVFYVKSLKQIANEKTTTIELIAVGTDGTCSDSCQTGFSWDV
jgi:endo-beta-N-acetylglucosaminidase D